MYKCSCGEMVVRNNLARHLKQKKQLQLLQDQEVIKEEEVIYLKTMEEIDVKIKEEAIQEESIEEPILEITEEEISLIQRLLTLFRG